MPNARKKRIPKLSFTTNRGVGWHVSYRDPSTGTPRKHRFGMTEEAQARIQYHAWLANHLAGEASPQADRGRRVQGDAKRNFRTIKDAAPDLPPRFVPASMLVQR